MTDDALRALRDAVKAGAVPEAVLHGTSSIRGHWIYTLPLDAAQRGQVLLAFRGSLDAAHALHKAVLPGWDVDSVIQFRALGRWEVRLGHGDKSRTGKNPDLARAWLLAILEALIAQQGAGKGET